MRSLKRSAEKYPTTRTRRCGLTPALCHTMSHTSCRTSCRTLCHSVQVFAEVDEQIGQVHAALATQTIARRSRANGQPITRDATNAAASIDNFISAGSTDRLKSMSSNITHFRISSQALMPTSWVKTSPTLEGMQRIDLANNTTMRKVAALCRHQSLNPPSGFVREHSFHYGKYNNKKLVSFLSLCVTNMNNAPGSIAISIDIAASNDKKHSMTLAIDSLKKMMRKRRNKCVLFAQVAQTASARTFWAGKLTKTKRASVIAALLSEFDERYLIYEDADDMAMFYE